MPMPYSLSKGTILAVLEAIANPVTPAEHDRQRAALASLRAGADLTTIGLVGSANIVTPTGSDPLRERLERNWFGKTSDGAGGWIAQAPFGPANPRTGYWKRYWGDVEGVLRETMIRATEVSLGIDHDADPSTATHHWPVEILWKCPNPWFEGWVTWRRHGPNPSDGQVTVIVASPGEDANKLVNVASLPPGATVPLPEPSVLPPDDQAMWVVTHEQNTPHTVDTLVAVSDGTVVDWLLDTVGALVGLPQETWMVPVPSSTYEGVGPIRVVHVPESAGGSAPFGQRYQP